MRRQMFTIILGDRCFRSTFLTKKLLLSYIDIINLIAGFVFFESNSISLAIKCCFPRLLTLSLGEKKD